MNWTMKNFIKEYGISYLIQINDMGLIIKFLLLTNFNKYINIFFNKWIRFILRKWNEKVILTIYLYIYIYEIDIVT